MNFWHIRRLIGNNNMEDMAELLKNRETKGGERYGSDDWKTKHSF